MRQTLEVFKILSDETKVRIIMLLDYKELSVCQIACVLDISQPLVSKNLSMLYMSGFLSERKEGKQVFYRVKKNLPNNLKLVMIMLRELLKEDNRTTGDIQTLKECEEFKMKTGKCDIKALKEFLAEKRRNAGG